MSSNSSREPAEDGPAAAISEVHIADRMLVGRSLVAIGVGVGSIGAMLTPLRTGDPYSDFSVGYLIGSIFGQAVAASAWNAFGPGPIWVRLVGSFVWASAILAALALNATLRGASDTAGHVGVMAACVASIWLFVQVPYWCLRGFGGIRLARAGATPATAPAQYGIGHLLIFTTVIALLLGAGRGAMAWFPDTFLSWGDMFAFLFLAAAAILSSLPLVPAILLPRYFLPAVFGILLLIGLMTWGEEPFFKQLSRYRGPELIHFIWINTFTAFWILVLGGLVRLAGYRLVKG